MQGIFRLHLRCCLKRQNNVSFSKNLKNKCWKSKQHFYNLHKTLLKMKSEIVYIYFLKHLTNIESFSKCICFWQRYHLIFKNENRPKNPYHSTMKQIWSSILKPHMQHTLKLQSQFIKTNKIPSAVLSCEAITIIQGNKFAKY